MVYIFCNNLKYINLEQCGNLIIKGDNLNSHLPEMSLFPYAFPKGKVIINQLLKKKDLSHIFFF